ncbi:TenA family protein [Thalassospira sp.]|uniref:TenA family protein n=1 Tax=Thalassospira sp. TaxID=1912094 RepID=UPI002735982E|nr:TenA family protein [Thalassospira sp.]MDP2697676.1 TenA family protein [Thalassospira sp.]
MTLPDWPHWHETHPDGTFSGWLRACCADDWHDVTHHPFTDAWGQSAVPLRNLQDYLIQDHRFIDRFVALLAGAVSRAPALADRIPGCQFLALVTGAENTYFERSFIALGVADQDRHDRPDWPVTAAFKDLMHDALHSNDYANMLAVLTVAEGTYLGWADRVNRAIATRPADFWYAEWIDLHVGDYFESVVNYLNTQLDHIGPTLNADARAVCMAFFRNAVLLEKQFFDTAWQGPGA